MEIVTYNFQFGLGQDGRIDLERIAGEVNGTDIIVLQEIDYHRPRSDDVDQAAKLGGLLNEYHWVYGSDFDVNASLPQPDVRIKNIRRQFGNMVLSKNPILSTRLVPLPKSNLYNLHVGVLEAVVGLQQGGALRIYNTHLCATSQRDRVAQIIAMRDIIRRTPIA